MTGESRLSSRFPGSKGSIRLRDSLEVDPKQLDGLQQGIFYRDIDSGFVQGFRGFDSARGRSVQERNASQLPEFFERGGTQDFLFARRDPDELLSPFFGWFGVPET